MSFETILVLVIAAIIIICISISVSRERDAEIKKNNEIYKKWDKEISKYTDYLIHECGYSVPRIRPFPLSEPDSMKYDMAFSNYEEEYGGFGLKAAVTIAGKTFDVRESSYNRLKIDYTDLQMQAFFARVLLEELWKKQPITLDKYWKKIAKKYEIEDIIPSYFCLLRGKMMSDDTDIDERVAIWKGVNKKKTIPESKLNEFRAEAERDKKLNELIKEFAVYLDHRSCGDICYEGESIEKCKSIRHRFGKYYSEDV